MVFQLSAEVKLPRAGTPVFPDECAGCGAPSLGLTYRVITRGPSEPFFVLRLLDKLKFLWRRRAWFRCEVPACASCRPRLTLAHRLRKAAYFGPLVPALSAYGWLRFADDPNMYLPLWIVGVWLVAWVVYEVARPEAVFIAETGDTITYEFRDRKYAERFARLNGAVVES